MRIRLLPLVLALAACTEPRAAPAPREAGREGILLAVDETEDGPSLDPIAILTPGGLADPFTAFAEDSAFVARYYQPGKRYALRVAGVPAGEVTVVEAMEPACQDRLAHARATLTRTLPPRWEALASDAFGAAPRQPHLREATDAEKAVLAALTDSIHADRGAPADRRRASELTRLYAVPLPELAEPVLVGTSNIAFQEEGFERVQSAMVVAERRDGAYRPAYVWYQDEREASMQRRALRDALDVDGDGVPELIAITLYYEAWDYAVLRRTPGGWTQIYQGGGGGC